MRPDGEDFSTSIRASVATDEEEIKKKEKNNSPMSKNIFVLFKFMLRALM